MPSFRDRNHLMRLLKMDLGIYSVPMPISDDELYQLVVVDYALEEFNTIMPYTQKIMMDIERDAVADYENPVDLDADSSPVNNLLRIPKYFKTEILGVQDVKPYNSLSNLSMSSSFETLESYQDLAQGQELANLSSAMIPPKTFEFVAPDKLRLYNNHVYNSKIQVEVSYKHAEDLHTIPETQRSEFYKLVLLSAKAFLYANLSHYNEIETAYGRVSLNIDKWEGAAEQRDELVEKWKETHHLDQTNMFWI